MPGGSKKGGGLKTVMYKMKNSMLKMSAKHKSPIQGNYGSPPTKHLGSATHPTGAIAAHEGHMSRKMTKKLKTKKD